MQILPENNPIKQGWSRWVHLTNNHLYRFSFKEGIKGSVNIFGQMMTRAGKEFVNESGPVTNYKWNHFDILKKVIHTNGRQVPYLDYLAFHYGIEIAQVMFRKDKKYDRIYACFPKVVNHETFRECYSHIGQHSSYHPDWLRKDTVPATQEEYQDLFDELCGLGYIPIVINRSNAALKLI